MNNVAAITPVVIKHIRKYLASHSKKGIDLYKDRLLSCGVLGEELFYTLHKIQKNEPVEEIYLLQLGWVLLRIEAQKGRKKK